MGKQYQLVRTASMVRRFTCGACEAHADVVLHARGESGWLNEGMFDPDPSGKLAMKSATLGLASDAGRILSLVRCPVCGHRSRRGVASSVLRYVFPFCAAVIGAGIFAAAAPDEARLIVALIAFPLCAFLAGVDEMRRWREAARCVKDVRPVKPLPKAIAKLAPPRPIVPLTTHAPEIVERASDDAGPSFLR